MFRRGYKMPSWPASLFHPSGRRTVRITNNHGNLKVKSMSILVKIKPLQAGSQTIVQFSAQGKLNLLLSLQENFLTFSMYSKSDSEPLSAKIMLNSNAGQSFTGTWYSVGVTYSHVTGNVTLYSDKGGFYKGFLGILEIEEPEYVYLGNNMESVTGGTPQQHSSGFYLGKMECFMVYRRCLKFPEIQQALNLCENLPQDSDEEDDSDDEGGGKFSYLIAFLYVELNTHQLIGGNWVFIA